MDIRHTSSRTKVTSGAIGDYQSILLHHLLRMGNQMNQMRVIYAAKLSLLTPNTEQRGGSTGPDVLPVDYCRAFWSIHDEQSNFNFFRYRGISDLFCKNYTLVISNNYTVKQYLKDTSALHFQESNRMHCRPTKLRSHALGCPRS